MSDWNGYEEPSPNVRAPKPLGNNLLRGPEVDQQINDKLAAFKTKYHDSEPMIVDRVVLNQAYNRGSVSGVTVNSDVRVENVKPENPHIITTPVVGERVNLIKKDGQFYYSSIINTKGQPNENSTATNIVTKFEDGFERKNTNQLTLKPGCMLFEGRYGNSIMFHSNDKQKPIISIRTDDATDGVIYDGSPQSDDSSIYLTSDGMDGTFDGEPIQGKNVLIQSDNILINGREKVRISSSEKKDIELKAGKGIILNPGEKQTVKMGDPRAPMLPTVNGQKLLEFQTSILGILTGINNILVSISAGPAALVKIANDARKLVNDVKTVKDSILKLEFLNFEVMTADPNFKIPERPKLPEIPQPPKTNFRIPEKPSLDRLQQIGVNND